MSQSEFHVEIPWPDSDAQESDFDDLRRSIQDGKTTKYSNTSDPNNEDDTSEDDETEPEEPGMKLLWACQRNKRDLVIELLDKDPSLLGFVDEDGYGPLHRASYSNHVDILKELLLRNGDVSASTKDGWIPLHSACRWNAYHCVELLLKWGSDVNRISEGGQTPLHLAAFHGNAKETIQLLLSESVGIHTNIKNAQGDTAKDISIRRSRNYAPLFEILSCPALYNVEDE